MKKVTAEFGDNQMDFINPETDRESHLVKDIEEIFNIQGRDLYQELLGIIDAGAGVDDIKNFLSKEVNKSLSIAETEEVMKALSSAISTSVSASTKRVIPYKQASMHPLIKVASRTYKHKYAEVYWQVKSMQDMDGKDRYFLVRIED